MRYLFETLPSLTDIHRSPNIEAATLQHRVKILTEQRLTAIKSLALNTTELAAEKASKEATLAHVRGQVSKFDLRITQLEKELGTAKGNNKKAEPCARSPFPLRT